MKTNLFLSALMLSVSMSAYADAPAGYYDDCEGLSGSSLLSKLCDVVGPHTVVSYTPGLWNLYKTSDVTAEGYIWDMYSTKRWTPGDEQCGSYSNVGDCYNREHSMPKSWFNDASPMYSDAFHIYPTDGAVNGQRGNYPYGECANGTSLGTYNGVQALGRKGTCTYPGYTGTVFEPDDEYKGDFARSYFYMAAAYNDRISSWSSDMLSGNAYPAFTDWALNLLLDWHRNDPVSQKELDRNEVVYGAQANRNPFIDHPELVEYIWGDKQDQAWNPNAAVEPSIVLPAEGSSLDFGNVSVGHARVKELTVKTINVSEPVVLSLSGDVFSLVDGNSVAASAANSTDGASVTLQCTATAVGPVSAELTLTCGDLSRTISLTATAYQGLPAGDPTNISDCGFTAHWTYIGDEDINGCYQITIYDAQGDIVDTYPRSVTAADESAFVDELEASTTYTYNISCHNGEIVSNTITVTTADPIPSIQFLYAGTLELQSEPGTPGDAVEVMMDVENIYGTITVSVNSPFELSSDKGTWTNSIALEPEEDRFYLRLNSANVGVFESPLTGSSTDPEYFTDDATVYGTCASSSAFVESFENEDNGTYSDGSVQGDMCKWILSNAGVYAAASEAQDGSNYMRLGKNSNSQFAMAEDVERGIGTVSMYVAAWSSSDGSGEYDLEYSTDSGESWQVAAHQVIDVSLGAKVYKEYTYTINCAGKVRIRVSQTSGKRLLFDNISMTSYTSSVGYLEGVNSNPDLWDAFCRNSQLIVSLANEAEVRIYGIDGLQYASTVLPAGESQFSLPAGLYVVAVADFTRRVLVK